MLRFLVALVLVVSASLPPQRLIQAMPAKTFIESLGVNVHMEYTDSQYADADNVAVDLAYLGIGLVRDNIPTLAWGPRGQGVAAIHSLAARGVKFDICLLSTDLINDMGQLEALERFHPGMIAAIEGPNEIDNSRIAYKGLNGQAAAEEFQKDAYRLIKSSRALQRIPVYHFTGGRKKSGSSLAGVADLANAHPYPRGGNPPRHWLLGDFESQYSNLGSVPRAITETGYYTLPESSDWGGVDGETQAKLLLTAYFTAAEIGISKTYVYQLLDAYADHSGKDIDKHFGLFDADGKTKPAAIAIHNLTRYLKDGSSKSAALRFGIYGLPAGAHSLLLSKSDGLFVLAIWNEVPVWDNSRKMPIQSPPISAKLCLTGKTAVRAYDPITGVESKIAHIEKCMDVAVLDHPTLLSIREED